MSNNRRKYSYIQRDICKRQSQNNKDDTIDNCDSELDAQQQLTTKTEPINETRWKMKTSYNSPTGSLKNYKPKYREKWSQLDNSKNASYRTVYVEKVKEPEGKRWNFKKAIPKKVYKEDIVEDSSSRESYDTLSTSAKSQELKKEVLAKQCLQVEKQSQVPKPQQQTFPDNKLPQQQQQRPSFTQILNKDCWMFIINQLNWLSYFRKQNRCYCSSCGQKANFQYQFCINCFMPYCYFWVVNHSFSVLPDHQLFDAKEQHENESFEEEQEDSGHCFSENERFIDNLLD